MTDLLTRARQGGGGPPGLGALRKDGGGTPDAEPHGDSGGGCAAPSGEIASAHGDARPHQAQTSPSTQAKGTLPAADPGTPPCHSARRPNSARSPRGSATDPLRGQVLSPCDGLIVYAGEFRTYGQLLIINAGGGIMFC